MPEQGKRVTPLVTVCPGLDGTQDNSCSHCRCALCRPDLIDIDTLKKCNAHYNLQNAFNVAEKELGLTKLLDPEGGLPSLLSGGFCLSSFPGAHPVKAEDAILPWS